MNRLGANSSLKQKIKKLGADRSFRHEERLFVCDGFKLMEEALLRDADIRFAVACEGIEFPAMPLDESQRFTCTESLMKSISPVKTPQGVLLVCGIPEEKRGLSGTRNIVLDGIRDPGNVGTILRTADAFGIDSIVFTEDCADAYNPKTVRGSMGAVFNNNFFTLPRTEIPGIFENKNLYAAAAAGDIFLGKDILSDCGVIIGNEGAGVSPELMSACRGIVTIPMKPRCESLNAAVAASVIMWEMSKC